MSRTLLQLVQDVTDELGITRPNAVVSSSDQGIIQLFALANRVGLDLVRDYEWQRLVTIYVFQTSAAVTATGNFSSGSATVTGMSSTAGLSADMVVSGTGIPTFTQIQSVDSGSQITLDMPASAAGTSVTLTFATQDYALPSDYDRMVSDTNWDRTNHWRNLGPKSSQEWQWLTGGVISQGPRERFRIYRNKLRLFNAPTTALNMAYEYVSKNFVIADGDTNPSEARFSDDADTCVFADDVMVLGIKYHWYRTKGLDYAVPLGEFVRALDIAKAQDQPVASASLAPQPAPMLVGPWSVPDGNWNL